MRYKIGFMQGRLVKPVKKNIIQYFPDKDWFMELQIGQHIFDLMEWTINIENLKKNPLIKKKLDKDFVKKIKSATINIESVTCDFFMQVPIFKKKYYSKYNEIKKYLLLLISNCEKLHIKFIILPLVDNSSVKNSNEENKLYDFIFMISKKLKKTQIIFETDYSPKEVTRFIERFDIKKFGINYDTGNSAALDYKIKDEINYFRYVKNIHIKDRKLQGTTVRLGQGNCNFKNFFYYLKRSKYKGNLILQTARAKKNSDIYEICLNKKYIESFL